MLHGGRVRQPLCSLVSLFLPLPTRLDWYDGLWLGPAPSAVWPCPYPGPG